MTETIKKIVRTFTGTVVSASAAKTLVVRVDVMKPHTKYRKSFRVSRKYHVHDEKGAAKVGEVVKFKECRPISKTKCWVLV